MIFKIYFILRPLKFLLEAQNVFQSHNFHFYVFQEYVMSLKAKILSNSSTSASRVVEYDPMKSLLQLTTTTRDKMQRKKHTQLSEV